LLKRTFRHKGLLPFFLVALFTTTACASCPPCKTCPECPKAAIQDVDNKSAHRWFVLRAIDGDTIVLRLEGAKIERKETVRLLNINTPEKNEPGFVEATEALKGLVRGGYVELEFEKPDAEKRDGFGRLLAYVIAEGVNVNVELVRQGWSKLYTKYGKGRMHERFVEAEIEAKANGRGLWASIRTIRL
jgi:endonuclease YncB( thermonuclease family)